MGAPDPSATLTFGWRCPLVGNFVVMERWVRAPSVVGRAHHIANCCKLLTAPSGYDYVAGTNLMREAPEHIGDERPGSWRLVRVLNGIRKHFPRTGNFSGQNRNHRRTRFRTTARRVTASRNLRPTEGAAWWRWNGLPSPASLSRRCAPVGTPSRSASAADPAF